ncbi:MAG: hypothetical protein QME40_02270 [bacterium]|nr:hypothetical protein [bacterium]
MEMLLNISSIVFGALLAVIFAFICLLLTYFLILQSIYIIGFLIERTINLVELSMTKMKRQ